MHYEPKLGMRPGLSIGRWILLSAVAAVVIVAAACGSDDEPGATNDGADGTAARVL